MSDYSFKHLPHAVYLDTNVLRSAGHNLNKPWISELLSLTNNSGISLCINELVLEEWCQYIIELLQKNQRRLLSSITLLQEYKVVIPKLKKSEIILPDKTDLIQIVRQRLSRAGFSIIKNWDSSLSTLLNEAIEKIAPFEKDGKGFCDVIILESYILHAKENFKEARVMVFSHDKAVRRSEERFNKQGINVTFVGETDILDKLKSLLEDELDSYSREKDARLNEFIITHEEMVLDFIKKSPLEITDWWLEGTSAEKELDFQYSSVERILSFRPTHISNVIGGTPIYGEEILPDRYPVQIFVEIELDIIVSQPNIFAQYVNPRAIVRPENVDENSPLILDEKASYQFDEVERTIKRSVTVYASLDADKKKEDRFEDLKLDKVF